MRMVKYIATRLYSAIDTAAGASDGTYLKNLNAWDPLPLMNVFIVDIVVVIACRYTDELEYDCRIDCIEE